MSNKTCLENLPDEILLLICRYLSSCEVLYSFFELNHRLSQTVNGYYRHVVIERVSYKYFPSICSIILPSIGFHIRSLILSDQWKGTLSSLFLNYFSQQQINSICPNLKDLTCIAFTDFSLQNLLNSLRNFHDFHQIKIHRSYAYPSKSIQSEDLLNDIFTTNNNRLNSILFDDESIVFSFENLHRIYSNINELSIDLKTIDDLHRLLTILPRLTSLSVGINENPSQNSLENSTEPIESLKIFRLQSFGPYWTFAQLVSVIKRMLNVEELSISLETNEDLQFVDKQHVLSLISNLSLRKFHYLIRCYYSRKQSIDCQEILSNWKDFQREIVCFQIKEQQTLVFYSLPICFPYLILPIEVVQNQEHFTCQVKFLTLKTRTNDFNETFRCITKCRLLENLNLRITQDVTSKLSNTNQFGKLSRLTKLTALNNSTITSDYLQKLFEIARNLQHLEVNYEFIQIYFDNEIICNLFQKRITHLYLLIKSSTDLELFVSTFDRFLSVFSLLKHFYISLEQQFDPPELIILLVLQKLSQLNSLISFGIVGIDLEDKLTQNLCQWIQNNSILNQQTPFQVNYTGQTFRLWL